ncbi:MarP family serine protease [Streptomyces chumphonensis]|uniref:MarP family serine protease n=1 Tax=Streptomyces chumphonensis TaxID=1214925 RepID=A0A927IBT9_9ACTN|nr:MarP family serine protease [Streptomyces chumphonensis]MBD3931352.1 MarP family serine protease [Streptomyces chumphonensis]
MNLIDVVLLLAAVAFAASGYQRGLVAALVSLAGFVGGAVVGVWLLPFTLGFVERGSGAATVTAVLTVLLPAGAGHALAARLGWELRGALRWAPVRWLDGVGGALANAVAVLLVGWVAASVLVTSPSPEVSGAVRGSTVLGAVQDRMPEAAPTWFSRATNALTTAGFPRVFNPFESEPVTGVPEPTGDEVTEAATVAAQRGSVKVEGVALVDGRRQGQEGSGFVYADRRVMTNAHVVAGVDRPTVRVGGVGPALSATVVHFDPDIDVAVLRVPELEATPLEFTSEVSRGDPAVVAGYPENGGLDLQAATVAGEVTARGQDIYNAGMVTREIHPLRGTVRPGNSGGPLLTPDGRVYGVVFARSVTDPDTGYALTADQVRRAAEAGDASTAPVDTGDRAASLG